MMMTKYLTVELPEELHKRVLASLKIVARHGAYLGEAAPDYDEEAMAEFLPLLIHAGEK
jgi:hypothetical protein